MRTSMILGAARALRSTPAAPLTAALILAAAAACTRPTPPLGHYQTPTGEPRFALAAGAGGSGYGGASYGAGDHGTYGGARYGAGDYGTYGGARYGAGDYGTYGGASYGGASYGGASYGAPGFVPNPGDPLAPPDPPPAPTPRRPVRPVAPPAGPAAIYQCAVASDCTVLFVGTGCLPGDPRAVATAHLAEARKLLRTRRPEPCGIGGPQYERDRRAIEQRYGATCGADHRCLLVDHGPAPRLDDL